VPDEAVPAQAVPGGSVPTEPVPADRAVAAVPPRVIRDPMALRAVAHPARLRLLEALALAGPATATELAEQVDESPANCSWHLRQLARYGFVEEAGERRGRQRPWRIVVQANSWGEGNEDPELALASDAATEVLFGREFEAMRAWNAVSRTAPARWREAAFGSQALVWLTPDELHQIDELIRAAVLKYLDRITDRRARPPESRPVRFVAWGFPADHRQLTPDTGDRPDTGDSPDKEKSRHA
jgi:DNA-binding transcriptional ArsR family regulator